MCVCGHCTRPPELRPGRTSAPTAVRENRGGQVLHCVLLRNSVTGMDHISHKSNTPPHTHAHRQTQYVPPSSLPLHTTNTQTHTLPSQAAWQQLVMPTPLVESNMLMIWRLYVADIAFKHTHCAKGGLDGVRETIPAQVMTDQHVCNCYTRQLQSYITSHI